MPDLVQRGAGPKPNPTDYGAPPQKGNAGTFLEALLNGFAAKNNPEFFRQTQESSRARDMQDQERIRQADQFRNQMLLHNTLSPYEKAILEEQKAAQQNKQQEDQLKLMQMATPEGPVALGQAPNLQGMVSPSVQGTPGTPGPSQGLGPNPQNDWGQTPPVPGQAPTPGLEFLGPTSANAAAPPSMTGTMGGIPFHQNPEYDPNEKKANRIAMPADSEMGKAYTTMFKGAVPDKEGNFNVDPRVLPFITENAKDRAKAEEQHAAMLDLQSNAKSLHGLVDNFIAKADPPTAAMFKSEIDTARTPQQLEGVSGRIIAYQTTNGPEARKRNLELATAAAVATDNAKAQGVIKRSEAMADSMYDVMMKTGMPPDVLMRGRNPEERMAITAKWVRDGKQLPVFLTQQGQKALTEIDSTLALAKEIKGLLEAKGPDGKALKDSSMPFSTLLQSAEYKAGIKPLQDKYINLTKVFQTLAAGRIAKASGSSTEKIQEDLKVHTPFPEKDSLALAYSKLLSIIHYIEDNQRNAVIQNNNKWGGLIGAGVIEDKETGKEETPQEKAERLLGK